MRFILFYFFWEGNFYLQKATSFAIHIDGHICTSFSHDTKVKGKRFQLCYKHSKENMEFNQSTTILYFCDKIRGHVSTTATEGILLIIPRNVLRIFSSFFRGASFNAAGFSRQKSVKTCVSLLHQSAECLFYRTVN